MNVINVVSIKSFYRFVEFVSKLCGGGLTHEKYKEIVLDIINAESIEEKEVKSLSNSYQYILNNINQSFSKDILRNAYYLLTSVILDDVLIDKILNSFYININDIPEHRAMYLQKVILKMNISRKIELAFILSNLIMLSCKRYPLIPYSHIFEEYKLNIKLQDNEKWLFLISQMEDKSKETQNYKTINKDDIIEIIRPRLNYITNKYNLSFLALYGGIVKGFITSSSDVDFLVSFNSELLDFERGQNIINLKTDLIDLLQADVDIIDFTHAINNLDIEEMENIIVFVKTN